MKTKILFSLALCIFLIATVSAINVDSEWSDGSNTPATINNGQSIDFTAYAFSIDPPMTIDVKLYDSDDNLIHAFENDLIVPSPTRSFSGTYTIDASIYVAPGTYTLKVNGIDTFPGSDLSTLTLVVNPVAQTNNLPVITSSPATSVNENAVYTYDVDATDADGNTLTYSLISLPPAWLSINSGTGLISGTAPSVAADTPFSITIQVSDGIGAVTQSYTLTVLDTSVVPPVGNSPVITILGANPITIEAGIPYADAGATAADVEDGDLTAGIAVTSNVNVNLLGAYAVVYSVTDSAGNTVTATRTVNVVDTTIPVITLLGTNPITITKGGTYTEPGAVATDNYDIGLSVTITGTVNTNTIGTYTITYTSTDSSGNSAVPVTRTVNVVAGSSSDGGSSSGSGDVVYSSTDVSGTAQPQGESEITSPPINLEGQKASSKAIWAILVIMASVLVLTTGAAVIVLVRRR